MCKSQCSLHRIRPRLVFFFCLGDQAKSQDQIQPQHLCRLTPAPMVYSTLSAVQCLHPGLSASLESRSKELFLHYLYVQITCRELFASYPSQPVNKHISFLEFFPSLHHNISRSRMLFNHQVSPFATRCSKPVPVSEAKGSGSRWCGRLFVCSYCSSFIPNTFSFGSPYAIRGAAPCLVFSRAEASRLPHCSLMFGI